MSGFVLHPGARLDLSEIFDFVTGDNPAAALTVLDGIERSIELLASNPLMGHPRPELGAHRIRFHAVGNFLIAYAPHHSPLLVLAVVHGKRNPRTIASILRSRA
jgi:plasmid stabilization system protein ParE